MKIWTTSGEISVTVDIDVELDDNAFSDICCALGRARYEAEHLKKELDMCRRENGEVVL